LLTATSLTGFDSGVRWGFFAGSGFERLLEAASLDGATGCFGTGAGSVCSTNRLLITVLTPATVAASLPAAERSLSLLTVPLSVTTPLAAWTSIWRLWMAESP
jgi:hypothetical protein